MNRLKPIKHGTLHAYIERKCRCDRCRTNIVEYRKKKAHERKGNANTPHGTINGYENYSCRCQECKRVKAKCQKEYTQTVVGKLAGNKAGRRWRKKNPDKTRAHWKVHKAIKAGILIRPDVCEHCKARSFTEATHIDYSEPFDIEWLCYSCHRIKDGLA